MVGQLAPPGYKRGQSQILFSGVQCHNKRQWWQTERGGSFWPAGSTSVLCSDRALAQFAQRGCAASSLEISKSQLDMFLDTLFYVSLLEQCLDQIRTEVPANISRALFLWLWMWASLESDGSTGTSGAEMGSVETNCNLKICLLWLLSIAIAFIMFKNKYCRMNKPKYPKPSCYLWFVLSSSGAILDCLHCRQK